MTINYDDLVIDIPATPENVREARKRLWYSGDLSWKLDDTQMKIYDFFNSKSEKVIVVNSSRRLGKSFLLTVMAMEQCYKHPKSIVKMVQPEQKMIRMNIRPIIDKILMDCPKELRPNFNKHDNIYIFPNGSELQLAGTDNGNHNKLRGGDSHLNIIDEAGFCSDLRYVINNVLIPTTTLTGGKILLSSTTPPIPEHEFNVYREKAASEGTLIVKTIYDAVEDSKHSPKPRITKEMVADIVKNIPGGENSDEFRTEYLCELIRNSDRAVIPEFNDVMEDVVIEWIRPPFFDNYTSMDIGFRDLTVVLFGYYDFDNAVVVIEDELVINGPKMTTDYLAAEIKRKEESLWTNKMTGEFQEPFKRISDNNPIVLNDLLMLHNLLFLPTQKDNKDAQVNNARIMISNRQVIISPKCRTLVTHLRNATWDKTRKDFMRSADNGHYDAVDSLIYLLRNLDKSRNPYPKGYINSKLGRHADLFQNPHYKPANTSAWDKFADNLKIKSSLYKKK